MARVTVEDCLENVENRFELVTLAARRARQIYLFKSDPLVDPETDKPTVIALREIAKGLISEDVLDHEESASEDGQVAFQAPTPGTDYRSNTFGDSAADNF